MSLFLILLSRLIFDLVDTNNLTSLSVTLPSLSLPEIWLTSTPSSLANFLTFGVAEDFDEVDAERYEDFFGPVDYEVPVPALVRETNLAPYQDLCYFVRPDSKELQYIAGVDTEFEELLAELRSKDSLRESDRVQDLDTWVLKTEAGSRIARFLSQDA